MDVEAPALVALQQGEIAVQAVLVGLQVSGGMFEVVDHEANVVPRRRPVRGQRLGRTGIEEEEGGRAGGEHGDVRIVPHFLHANHVDEEVSSVGSVGHGDGQVIEADVLPLTGRASDRLGAGDDIGGPVVIGELTDEVVGEDLVACRGGKGQAASGGDCFRERVSEGVVHDISTTRLRYKDVIAQKKPNCGALIGAGYCHGCNPLFAMAGPARSWC